jgi:hypothetical protein
MRWTEETLDILKDFLTTKIEGYLDVIRTETGQALPSFTSIDIGQDYTKRGRSKPFVLIDPASITPDAEGYGVISGDYRIDMLIVVDGYESEIVSRQCMRYADAVTKCIWDYDTLDGQVVHASVETIEYFPGGTGNEKYALIAINVMREMYRG